MWSIVNEGKRKHKMLAYKPEIANCNWTIKPSACGMQTMSHTAPSFCLVGWVGEGWGGIGEG